MESVSLEAYAVLGAILLFVTAVVIHPLYDYVRGEKCLRQYPVLHWTSPFTNLYYMWATYTHQRYKVVHAVHQKYPIVRLGPRSISFGQAIAIKDVLGFGSNNLKDDFYKTLAGTTVILQMCKTVTTMHANANEFPLPSHKKV